MIFNLKNGEIVEISEEHDVFMLTDKLQREYAFPVLGKTNPSMLILLESDPEFISDQLKARGEIPESFKYIIAKLVNLALDFGTAYWQSRALLWLYSDMISEKDFKEQLSILATLGKSQYIRHSAQRLLKRNSQV